MISKEKLLNGYIKNEEGELMDLFIKSVLHYFPNAEIKRKGHTEIWAYYNCNPFCSFGCTQDYVEWKNHFELTLDDFKEEKVESFLHGAQVTITFTDDNGELSVLQRITEREEIEEQDERLTKEINKTYEKMEAGETEFYSSESAEQIMGLRKKRTKTKVEYVKCEFPTVWEAVKGIEEGGILFKNSGGTYFEAVIQHAVSHKDKLYKKVVKEIDWKEEVSDYLNCTKQELEGWFQEFPNKEEGFKGLCYLVTSLTHASQD